ncbi:signal peptidase I [Paraclostridium sordellii]|uniref:signal peptidase I n=1 Tax=Paraclostridium sordellii TaxID=1505 RepID=UPI00070E30FD
MEGNILKSKIISKTIEWGKVTTLAVIMGLIVTYFIIPTVVSGESMYPTLNTEDYLIINKITYKNNHPNRGDIVVFRSELKDINGVNKSLIKRIIGVPGDHIVIKNGDVYINDQLSNEPYINDSYTDGYIDMVIPKGYYFAMGDNRVVSKDSRDSEVGVISESDIVGKVNLRLFPLDEIGTVS